MSTHGGNKTRVAKELDVDRKTLNSMISRLGVQPGRLSPEASRGPVGGPGRRPHRITARTQRIAAFAILIVCSAGRPAPAQLASGCWPVFRGDLRHTGRSLWTGPANPALYWSYRTGDMVEASPAVGTDGRTYVGSCDRELYAIESTGALAWSYRAAHGIASSPALGHDGRVYTGSGGIYDNTVYAVESTGVLAWSYRVGSYTDSSPALGSDGRIYIGAAGTYFGYGVSSNRLFALHSSGALAWSYRAGDAVGSSPAVGSDGRIRVGSDDCRIYTLESSGALAWSYRAGDCVYSSPALGTGGQLYVGSGDMTGNHRIYALDPAGSLIWSYRPTGFVYSSPALGSDGTIYAGADDSVVYALGSAGALAWSYRTGDQIGSSACIGKNGAIYIGSFDTALYALDSAGGFLWSYRTGAEIWSSPALAKRLLYFGSCDNVIYCLGPAPQPTPTPTPPGAPSCESFEGVFPPQGWAQSGCVRTAQAASDGAYSVSLSLASHSALITPPIPSGSAVSFMRYAPPSGLGTPACSLIVERSYASGGPWTALPGSPITAGCTAKFTAATVTLPNTLGPVYVRFRPGNAKTYLIDMVCW